MLFSTRYPHQFQVPPTMNIRLSTEDRVYTTGETITGELVIKPVPSCERLRISITLKGYEAFSSLF
jgi:hypothetical protein